MSRSPWSYTGQPEEMLPSGLGIRIPEIRFRQLVTRSRNGNIMKKINPAIAMFFLGFCAAPFAGKAQSFQDLNFESATVTETGVQPYGTFVPIGSVLPDWTAYLGTQQVTQVGFNSPANSTASITLIGPTWNNSDVNTYGVGVIDGNFSVDLQTGANPLYPTPATVNASIAQTGMVPATAQSLEFDALETTPLSVSFDGNALTPVALSSSVSADGLYYTAYSANVSAFAGQTGSLEFTADVNSSDNYVVLDDISFSSVPEPSAVTLIFLAGVGCATRKRLARL